MRFVPNISRDVFRRIGWLLLATLFVITGLGVGVYAFWQNTHQGNSTQPTTASCTFNVAVPANTYPAPASYTAPAQVTQLAPTDLAVGSGKAAKSGDCLDVKYYGTLVDGAMFDENYSKTTALEFQLGQGQVIPGWDIGLIGMKVGGTRRLLIPSSMAYGNQAQGTIPANSNLVFEVKLLSIK